MPHIQKLSPHVVNQIAAGEVIERPASVVKELLENSVDSGATRIDVALEQGGLELIRISDNGSGIASDEMLLAVTSHATSKLRDADDLFRVATLGFRGEALASIAAVSHLTLRSCSESEQAGALLEVNGGSLSPVTPFGCPKGTVVEVRNLFFNTPVRRRFMRTSQTEFGHASEAFARVALAYPDIHFTLEHQGRRLYDLPPTDRWRDRIVTFFGDELRENLIWIDNSDETLRLSGYAASPSINRGNNRMQYVFLNGRYIRDRSLQHALGEAYRGLIMTGRYPVAFLRLDMQPELVDVNVHPTKLEVRFQDGGRVYSQLLGTLRSHFLSTDLTVRVQPAGDSGGPAQGSQTGQGTSVESHQAAMRAWARGESESAGNQPSSARQASLDLGRAMGGTPAFRPFDTDRTFGTERDSRSGASPESAGELSRSDAAAASPTGDSHVPPPYRSAGVQLHNRYLVAEHDQGMVVIDQHALHERILYEQLRQTVLEGRLESQRLLVPEPVTLAAPELAAALEARETLARLGIDVQPFGGDTVLVSSYPAMLAKLRPEEVLRQVVEQLVSGGKMPDRRDLLDELLHMIACKAAIKAGDRLSPEEVNALLEQRHHCQDTHHCPHGRPAALVFTREELDRRFRRT